MEQDAEPMNRYLILPSWLYWLAWSSAALTLALCCWAGSMHGSEQASCPPASRSEFLAADADLPSICALVVAPQTVRGEPDTPKVTESAAAPTCSGSLCERQCRSRERRIEETKAQMRSACRRHAHYEQRFVVEPLARRVVAEEASELNRLYGTLRELQGPKPDEETRDNFLRLAITCALSLATLYGFGRHARYARIPRCRNFVEVRRAFLATAGATLVVAGAVIMIESLDEAKVGFDWSSFCIDRTAFLVNHAIVLPLSLLVATQLSAGFFAMRPEHLPRPDMSKPAWGVRSYVTFLETWCFLLVVIVAFVAAFWLHKLAHQPTRTNVILSFLGWGALGSAAVLAVRMVRTAMALRDRCEQSARTVGEPPNLPTEFLLGKSWWQAPAVFAAAGGIAWWLLETADALKLYTSP